MRKPIGRQRFITPRGFSDWKLNDILLNWGAAFSLSAVPALGSDFKINTMYLEFDTSGASSPPTFNPKSTSSGAAYYNSLGSHSTRDYVRVPILAAKLIASSSDYSIGNILKVIAQTSGGVGIHGKMLAAGDAIIGAALVAANGTDLTRDILVARIYHEEDQQPIMPAIGSIYSEWELDFSLS